MATSTIPTHNGTSQTPTVPAYVEIEQNKSKLYPNGQKLLQVHMHVTSAVGAEWALLGTPAGLQTNVYLSVPVVNSNTGDVYGALMSGDILKIQQAAPAGWYGVCVLYE